MFGVVLEICAAVFECDAHNFVPAYFYHVLSHIAYLDRR